MSTFTIPDFTPLLKEIKDFVREQQGSKGYIDTRNTGNDTIWCFYYDDAERQAAEVEMLGIRVRNNDVEVLPDFWDLDIFKDSEDLNESEMWHSLKDSDIIYYEQTIINIASNIEEYV